MGVLDTGIWPEHPSFRNTGLPAPPGTYGCQFGTGLDPLLGAPYTCNNKLIGAYAFTQTYMSVIGSVPGEFCNNATGQCSARDSEGHGTHTTSTAAGDVVDSAPLFGVERGPVAGVAPGAYVIMYRVCLAQGCFNSDSVNAVKQAILDGVDVINFSIGGGANPYADPVELAFLDAFNAGINVNASAGNSGPGAGTAEHGGPWVTTVGASTWDHFFSSTLHLASTDGSTLNKPGVTITAPINSPTPVVLATSLPGQTAICDKIQAAGTATGKIVACQRGGNARVDKGYNVLQGGAAGMILYNAISQDVETDNHWLPAIHVDGPNADLVSFLAKPGVTATFATGTETLTQPDVMATFSSRGPVGDFIKPDITAPGIQVLMGMTPQPTGITNGPPGQFFQAIAGTSMSSPHAAGASALVRAAHPSWTPAEVKSALMTTALQDVTKENGTTDFDPFDAGAGSLQVNDAVAAPLVFDETTADFVSSATNPLNRIDLNLASIDATTMTGKITTQRTAINVSGKDLKFDIKITEPAGVDIIVGNNNKPLSIAKNSSLTFPITISAPAVANGQYFARITLFPNKGEHNVTIPVAFVRKQGVVTLTHACAPTSIPTETGVAHCSTSVANLGSTAANVSLSVANDDNGKLDYSNASPPASIVNNAVTWSGSLSPAVPPQVTSITAGGSPAGYLPLSLFGIAPFAATDDSITNFNVPQFFYGGEPYTRVGVVSNGYLVIGGGTGSDIVFTPQQFPNPNRPNNVVAPFWSDLNPPAAPAGGGIRVGILTDGVNRWLVVDWDRIPNFSNATNHSFQVWIQLGATPSTESITMAYGTAGAGDPASGVNWGAENRDGTSGKNLAAPPANGSDFTIHLTPPTAGGTQTITYDASSKKAGTYTSLASMTSNLTPGVTQVPQTITVFNP